MCLLIVFVLGDFDKFYQRHYACSIFLLTCKIFYIIESFVHLCSVIKLHFTLILIRGYCALSGIEKEFYLCSYFFHFQQAP